MKTRTGISETSPLVLSGKRFGRLILLSAVFALAGCGSLGPFQCSSGQEVAVQEFLYFGAETPAGQLSQEEWALFLKEVVTPRFPQGLTVWPAYGQWHSAAGSVVKEPSFVLSLVHPPSAAADVAIQELIAVYKARFAQEAVLRVRSEVCVSL